MPSIGISPAMIILVIGMLGAASTVLAYVVAQNTGPRAQLKARIAALGAHEGPAVKKGGAVSTAARRSRQIKSKLEDAGKSDEAAKPSRRSELRLMIERAGLATELKTFYIWSTATGVAAMLIYLIMRYAWWGAPFVLVIMGVGFPRWVLKKKGARRQRKFTQHFADAIDVIVRGIKSGLPVGECLNIIAREAAFPVNEEFKLLVESQKLGMTFKQALERSCRRMPTPDMKFFAIVINLQQQTGGNLAETLAGLSDVLRDRKRMADKVRAMSSEARMTAMIIGSMPFLISGLVYLINPGYISLLWTDHTGRIIFFSGLGWMSIGVFMMKQMINVEI